MHIPAPKPPLPGHSESYNPPPEYLPTPSEVGSPLNTNCMCVCVCVVQKVKQWEEEEEEGERASFLPHK